MSVRAAMTAGVVLFLMTATDIVERGLQTPRVILGIPHSTLMAQTTSTTYKDVYDGWKWWHVYCYRCHGVDAVGTTNAPNLTDPNGKLNDAAFLKIVREGRSDKGMQAWDKLLDDKQIQQIHLYVRARTDKILPAGRPDEVGPNKGPWVPPAGWPKR
jgi:mono/diheme cytochrome c family protein